MVFAVTVDLFDDPAVDHLHHVADTLTKRDQLLIVITKANTMNAAAGVREAAVAAALGASAGTVPWVESDARDYLDGLGHPDPARQQAYRQMSGIDAVRSAINDISARRGDLARYRQPFQAVIAVALETEALLTSDPTEAAALALLARQRSALTVRRERIEAHLDDLRSGFLSESVRAAEEFADSIESIDDVPEGRGRTARIDGISADLNRSLTHAADRLAEATTRILTTQFDDLASEVREIEASPHTRVVLSLGQNAQPSGTVPDVRIQGPMRSQSAPAAIPAWVPDARRWLKEFQVHWGAGSGIKASSGTAGHQVVLEVGHRLGAKFKPWQAARVANRIGQAVKVASVVVTVGLEVAQVVTAERAEVRAEQERHKRRTGLVNEVVRQATAIADAALSDVRLQLDPVFQQAFSEIDSIHSEIVDARTHRSASSRDLARIRAEASEALRALTPEASR